MYLIVAQKMEISYILIMMVGSKIYSLNEVTGTSVQKIMI